MKDEDGHRDHDSDKDYDDGVNYNGQNTDRAEDYLDNSRSANAI